MGNSAETMFHLPQFPQIDIIGYPYMVVGFRRRGRPLCLPVGCSGLAIFPCLARFLETKGRATSFRACRVSASEVLCNKLDLCIQYMYCETMRVRVIWDPEKAKINLRKHRVRFADAEPVFFDPMALTREDDDSEGEQRLVSVGLDALSRILVVVYTYRGADIRLISARRATSKERKHYEKGL